MAALEGGIPAVSQFRGSLPMDIPKMATPPRPASALARGVNITEYNNSRVNPDPIIIEDSDLLLEEYLSPRKLRLLTGVDNLEEVHYLEMKVDTRDTSLGNFGSHVPNLTQLKLSNSIISSVRDLGSCLNNVRVLWLARSGVEDVDGISSMNNLRELYLAYNEISDISPISMVEHLQILDLEGNNIDDIAQVEFLSLCHKLHSLTVEGNPICVTPSPNEASPSYNLREAVKRAIPHLKLLDDEPLVDMTGGIRRTASAFDDDWKLLDELLDEGIGASDISIEAVGVGRPGTGIKPTTTTYRPGSALKPYMAATGIRPGTQAGRPGSGRPGSGRPGTASRLGSGVQQGLGSRPESGTRPLSGARPGSGSRPHSSERPGTSGRPGTARSGESHDEMDSTEDVSDLTQGNVVCGNPSKALRARNIPASRTSKNAMKIYAHLRHKAEHTYDTALEDDENMMEILSELQEWKKIHHKRVDEIQATKAPQVLKIDHDDAVSLSDDDESLVSDDEADLHTADASMRRPIEFNSNTENQPSSHGDVRPKSRVFVPKFSPEETQRPPSASRRHRLPHDESFDAREDGAIVKTPEKVEDPHNVPKQKSYRAKSQSQENIRSPSPFTLKSDSDELRPFSGPDPPMAKFKLQPVVDKTRPKVIDRANPVIRASVHTPEKPKVEWPRATTSRAAIGQPAPQTVSRMRKGHLANVQLLPSKPPSLSK